MSYCTRLTCGAINLDSDTECSKCSSPLLLHNQYLPIAILGQGAFGRTLKAIDTQSSRKPCAVKQFTFNDSSLTTQATAVALFEQEAKHLQALGNHPQIPALVNAFTDGGQSYLVQEFIDGQSLEQELAIDGKFNQHQVRELLESLLPVLSFLHSQTTPVIHRDIKPANIIRRRGTGELVLVDFGAAKLVTHTMLAKTGTSIGSAEYVSIEQSRGKATFASDIYSLGVTCIHLLTNTRPFDLYSVNTEDGWAWRDYLDNNPVDSHLAGTLDRMIAQNLKQRYQLVAEVVKDLGKAPAMSITVSTNPKKSFSLAKVFDLPNYFWLVPGILLAIYGGQISNALKFMQPANSFQVSNKDILAISWMDNSINTVKPSEETLDEQDKVIERFTESTLTGLLNWKVGAGSPSKKPDEYLNFGEGYDISILLDNAPPSVWRSLLSIHPDMRRQTLLTIARTYKKAGITTGNQMRWVKHSLRAKRNDQGYWTVDTKGEIEIIDKKGVKQATVPFNKQVLVAKSGIARPSSLLFLFW